ncbi:TIGR03016 family PEP-CTERM system-associated outer membrane protein [Rhodoferax sp. WC2427]|uniref:TIGR03016 family PEP-CTERM system-associated outer membrane protein n=1 Tax=Rhodoferax sp. WC2427 TaxID=3234144 RepID=UPI003467D8FA
MNLYYDNSCAFKCTKLSFVLVVLLCIATNSNAQESLPTPSNLGGIFHVSPSLSLTETWTDNLSLENGSKKSGWITEISPGLNIRSGSGRVKGYLNYSLNILNHSGGQGKNSLQNSLNSSVNIEAIDRHGFVDISGVITQQTISAFSIQNSNLDSINSNKTEVSTYSLAPYYRGRLSKYIDYEARYSLTTTRAKSANNFSSDSKASSISLNGDEFFGRLSWTLGLNRQIISRNSAPDTEVDSVRASLNYPIVSNLVVSVSGGRERQNYTSTGKVGSWTSGMGLNWSVSEMTKISANIENNPLGKMHSLNFEHRTPRTSWRLSDVRSVSMSNGINPSSLGGNYDLLFNQFSSIEPDPIKRAQLVNSYLQTYGINPNSVALNGYLTSGTSLQRAQNISFALLGLRDTITFTASRSTGKSVSTSPSLIDDFSNSSSIRQNGLTIAYTHRLTPDTTISNQISIQKTSGQLDSQKSEVRSANISASTRVGPKAYLTVSARRSVSASGSFPYSEAAVTGNLTVQF